MVARMAWNRFRRSLVVSLVFSLVVLSLPVRIAVPPAIPTPAPAVASAPDTPTVHTTTLRPRETLEMALRRGGVPRPDAIEISAALRREVNLRKLAPGEQLAVERGRDGAILGVVHQRSKLERYEVRPDATTADTDDAQWTVQAHRAPITTRTEAVTGRLEDSLFASVERLGEKPVLTAKFVSLFEWDFDFAADSLPGDEFKILVEKRFAGEELIGYGEIVAAEYRGQTRPALSAVRFPDADGSVRYYDYRGEATRKMFLRAPLEFTRITSGYSRARRHPILGGVRPHLAIDYGAPTGTPVRAVADGVVVASGRLGGYGLSVTVRHTRGYETSYNHLSKITARRGARVKQRELVGLVGATGLATGPHLHYEVRKNGASVDPTGEKFIPGDPVSRQRMRAFQAHVQNVKDQLALGNN